MPKLIDLSNVRANRTGRVWYKGTPTPWVTVPNVKQFDVDIGKMDIFFALFGINRTYRTHAEFIPYKNKSMKRYAEHQIKRLGMARDNGNHNLYFKIADTIMKRSNVFRVMAMNHVFPQWHRKLPLKLVLQFNRQLSKLINCAQNRLDYRRVYVPKTDGRWRPLGVPKPEWRLLLHMYSNFTTFYLHPKLSPHLHGFLPGRGVITAWKEIMSGLHKKANIYEWDFKGFFDHSSVRAVTMKLERLNFPRHWVYFLEKVNTSPIKLLHDVKDDLTDEKSTRLQLSLESWADKRYKGKQKNVPDVQAKPWMQEALNQLGPVWAKGYRPFAKGLNPITEIDPVAQEYWSSGFIGFPQGAPTSPILTNLLGQDWVKAGKKAGVDIVMYADDSVGFSDDEIDVKKPRSLEEVKFAKKKCGYVKRDGVWLKPLVFLGLALGKDFFRAHTRKGSRLELTGRELLLSELFTELHERTQELNVERAIELVMNRTEELHSTGMSDKLEIGPSYDQIFKSRLAGWIVNRLQSGSFNTDDITQDFNMKFVRGSWMDTKLNHWDLNIFNSSSYANFSLLNIFRWNSKIRAPRKVVKVRWISSN
jgi:hypothetical protein